MNFEMIVTVNTFISRVWNSYFSPVVSISNYYNILKYIFNIFMFVRCELTSHCSCSSLHPEDRLDCVSFYVFSSVQSLSLVRLCDPIFHECTVHFSVGCFSYFFLLVYSSTCLSWMLIFCCSYFANVFSRSVAYHFLVASFSISNFGNFNKTESKTCFP